jgi:hypothetical protein
MPTPLAATTGYVVGVDLGQAQDFTAIAILERRIEPVATHPARLEARYDLRHLERPALGTRYPAIVAHVLGLLSRPPLHRGVPLVVDKTGVGAAVVDMFTDAGVKPRAVTITGGDEPNTEDRYNLKVPKRDLAGVLVALFQTGRLRIAESLELAPALTTELVNFKVKVNLATGHDSYEAWRESVHDDLVLAVALACWHAEAFPPHFGPAAVAGPPSPFVRNLEEMRRRTAGIAPARPGGRQWWERRR